MALLPACHTVVAQVTQQLPAVLYQKQCTRTMCVIWLFYIHPLPDAPAKLFVNSLKKLLQHLQQSY